MVENPKIEGDMSREKIIRIKDLEIKDLEIKDLEIKDLEQRELKEEIIGIRKRDKKVDRKVEIM